jgi:hypothetical protein
MDNHEEEKETLTAPSALTDGLCDRDRVIALLIAVAREAFYTLEDCEEACDTDGHSHFNITGDHARALSAALDELDELPEDLQPNVVMTGPAKAEWILRAHNA